MIRQKFTAELSETIRLMWFDGFDAVGIAAKIGVQSVDCVTNHIHKKGYHRRPGFIPRFRITAARRDHAKLHHEPPPKLRDGEPITLINAKANECRWMYGDGAAAQLCANRTLEGDSYCPHHAARAYNHDAVSANIERENQRAALFDNEQARHAR